jgi:hypothetical protein
VFSVSLWLSCLCSDDEDDLRKKILLGDDSGNPSSGYADFRQSNSNVVEASNGEAAIKILEESARAWFPPDICMLGNGYEVALVRKPHL